MVINVPKETCCCCFEPCFNFAEDKGKKSFNFCKKIFCLPDDDENTQLTYSYYNDVVKAKPNNEEVVFGHKAFFWPREKPKCTFSPRSRISFSLARTYFYLNPEIS